MYLTISKQKKIAVINDFSGFGRCSLSVSIPIISAAGIQCCAVPTAVLSNHTGYEDYFFDDYTDKMSVYYSKWEKLNLSFDAIYTGFLGSVRQIAIVEDFIDRFAGNETHIIVDPVMGDNGRIYATLTSEHCRSLRRLAARADVLTPNLTEACILTGIPYNENICEIPELLMISEKLRSAGSRDIVITGIKKSGSICNFIYKRDGSYSVVAAPSIGCERAGTGDVFAAVLVSRLVCGDALEEAVERSSDFVLDAIRITEKLETPPQDGLCFELLLGELCGGQQGALL